MGHPDGRRPRTRARTRTHNRTPARRRAHARTRPRTRTRTRPSTRTRTESTSATSGRTRTRELNARTHTHTHANAPRTRTRTRARTRAHTRTRARTRDDPPRQSAATACVSPDGLESPRSKKTRTVRARPAPQPGGAKRVGRSSAPTSTGSPHQRRPRGSNRHPPGEHDVGPDSSATESCRTGLWPTGLRSNGARVLLKRFRTLYRFN